MQLPPSDPGKDPLTPQYRGFSITVNTNSPDRHLINPLRTVWKYVVAHAAEFLLGRPGGRLLEVKEYHNVEVGHKYRKIHIQSYFTCKTLGFSLFDLNKLRTFINTNLKQVPGYVRSNIWVRPLKQYNIDRVMQDYVSKDPIIEELQDTEFDIIPPE